MTSLTSFGATNRRLGWSRFGAYFKTERNQRFFKVFIRINVAISIRMDIVGYRLNIIRHKNKPYTSPEDCHSPRKNWTLVKVLVDRGPSDISLAIGRWDQIPRLAIRWNGTSGEPLGNPQSRGLPTWFMLPPDYAQLILDGLPADDRALARKFIPKPGSLEAHPSDPINPIIW